MKLHPTEENEESDKQTEPAVHEITINFRTMPTQFVIGLGAGTLSPLNYNFLTALLGMRWMLSRNGRRSDLGG